MNSGRSFVVLLITGFCLLGNLVSQDFQRITVPVEKNGSQLAFPFAGGLDAPQIIPVYLDDDELEDIIIFDRVGNVILPLIRQPQPQQPAFSLEWEFTGSFPHIQQWMKIRDFNQDGLPDIFASTNEPGIQGIDVYRGVDDNGQLAFEQMAFSQGQYDLIYIFVNNAFTPMYAAWIDIPAFEDVDGDGDIDILVFEPGGKFVHYFKNTSLEQGLGLDTLDFVWEDICWGKFFENELNEEISLSENPNQCATGGEPPQVQLRHSGSTMAAFDKDGDGDLELYLGDLSSTRIVELINGGTPAKAFMTDQEIHFPADNVPVDLFIFPAPIFTDINNDGLVDFLATSNSPTFSENHQVIWYYENTGQENAPEYSLRQKDLFVEDMLDFGTGSRPCFVDVNADSLPDILVGTEGYYNEGARDPRLSLLLNTGTASQPMYTLTNEDYLGFSSFASIPTWAFAPAAGDIDGDGDTDLIVGEQNGQLFFVENIAGAGNPSDFADPVYPYMDINVGVASTPFIVDINGDGLMDLVVGERTGNNDSEGRCGNLNYYQNQGTSGNPDFDADVTAFPNTNCMGSVLFNQQAALREYSAPFLFRNEDGLQLITGSEQGQIRHYSDIEGNVYESFSLVNERLGDIRDGFRTSPVLEDIDGDGFYEMLLGNLRGGLTLFNTGFDKMTTATHDPIRNTGIKITPNPASASLRIVLTEQHTAGLEVHIFNAAGVELINTLITGTEGQLDIRHLPEGIYFVRVEGNGNIYQARFVKVH